MEEPTRAYLSARFGDYYGRTGVQRPPAAERREWGYIPFSPGGTTMARHRSLLDMGTLEEFLARQAPRHVYYSAARYDDPDMNGMAAKGWQGADLIFDLDADHLPGVDPASAGLREMLAACKGALERLLDLLEADLGFGADDVAVAFSGGRGYHVHVRDGRVLELGRDARREIADYVLGEGVGFDALVETETVSGAAGRETPADKRTLRTDGGWGRRVHRRLVELVEELRDLEEAAAVERLTGREGIGPGRAAAILTAARERREQIAAGNVDVHPAFVGLARAVAEETVAAERAPIDEPVTTDVNRLIRLPGSLHGGTTLRVTPVGPDELEAFDPFEDAVPETFRTGREIAVDVREPGPTPFTVEGDSFTVAAGEESVPEHVGLFLMARGRAERAKER